MTWKLAQLPQKIMLDSKVVKLTQKQSSRFVNLNPWHTLYHHIIHYPISWACDVINERAIIWWLFFSKLNQKLIDRLVLAINIEYENIEFENGSIEIKVGNYKGNLVLWENGEVLSQNLL
jgi:hypothetical protein